MDFGNSDTHEPHVDLLLFIFLWSVVYCGSRNNRNYKLIEVVFILGVLNCYADFEISPHECVTAYRVNPMIYEETHLLLPTICPAARTSGGWLWLKKRNQQSIPFRGGPFLF